MSKASTKNRANEGGQNRVLPKPVPANRPGKKGKITAQPDHSDRNVHGSTDEKVSNVYYGLPYQNEVESGVVNSSPALSAVNKKMKNFASFYYRPAYVAQLRQGADRQEIDQVASMANLTKKEIAHLLGVSERHLYNHSSRPLTTIQTEFLQLLKNLFSYGDEFFAGNTTVFSGWLRTPLAALAIPETGFPSSIPADYVPPTIEELFAGSTEAEEQEAIQANLAYMRHQQSQPGPEYPTPLSLLDTLFGVQQVKMILGRVNAGVFS